MGKARQGFRKLTASYRQWEIIKSQLNRLIVYQRIELSSIWAKELQQYAEEIVSLAKKNTPYHDGLVESMLKSPEAREVLYERLVPRYHERKGLCTRVVNQFRFRERDTTPISFIEFIDRSGELFPASPNLSQIKENLQSKAQDDRKARRNLRKLKTTLHSGASPRQPLKSNIR